MILASRTRHRLLHMMAAKVTPRGVLVMGSAAQSQIIDCLRPALRPRLYMIDLQELPRYTTPAVLRDEGARTIVA
jgi:hypothetical protein